MFDVDKIRADFPLLSRKLGDHQLVYFDNAATTQKPLPVIRAMATFYQENNANIHRGIHTLSTEATAAYENVRRNIAEIIGLDPTNNKDALQSVVFTSGTTDSINLVAYAWGMKFIEAGDEIILSEEEHHSNIIPWQLITTYKNANLRFIPINSNGELDLTAYKQLFTSKTKFVSLSAMSNVFGLLNPIAELTRVAHEHGVPILLDAAQAMAHYMIDVKTVDCDFLAFSAHKMLGPTGVGVLYGKPELLDKMSPFRGGGEMISQVGLHRSSWADLPYKFEAGTMNIAGVVGYGAAIDYLCSFNSGEVYEYEKMLTNYAYRKLDELKGVTVYGTDKNRIGVIAFNVDNVHCHDLAQFMDSKAIAIRAGHHCAQPLMEVLGVPATARISLYFYNTIEEIDYFIDMVKEARAFFG